MTPGAGPGDRWWPTAAFILFVTLLSAAAGWRNSATMDEPAAVLAAYVMVHDGYYDFDMPHPPLVKFTAGTALALSDLDGPGGNPGPRLARLHELPGRFLFENRKDAQTILRTARLPLLLFLILTLVVVWAWSKELYGAGGAWIALILLGTQPLLLGHAQVVQTDVAMAAAWCLSFYLLWRLTRSSSWRGAFLFGLSVGLALLAKFTAIYLILFLLVTLLITSIRPPNRTLMVRAGAAFLIGFLLLMAGYRIAIRNHTPVLEEKLADLHLLPFGEEGRSRAEQVKRVSRVSPSLSHYLLGVSFIDLANRQGQGVNYFFGKTRQKGFTAYFPVGFLLKSTAPFLLALFLALLSGRPRREEILFLLLPAALLLFVSLFTSFNIGIRHILPLYPLAAVFSGRMVRHFSNRWIVPLLTVQVILTLTSFPHYLSHFNMLAGGRSCGHHYLADSNLDWGQDWLRASRSLNEREIPFGDVTYLYIGTMDPGRYLPGALDFFSAPTIRTPRVIVSEQVRLTGVATLTKMGLPGEASRLASFLRRLDRAGQREEMVGGSLGLYRFSSEGE